MREIVFNGVLVRYRTWGEGAAVALLHSGGSSSAQWERIAPALAPVRTVIAPDLLGFGASEAWPAKGALTHDLQADMVSEVARAAAGTGAIDIVGHSYGGATAVRLALRRPELVRSLVLIEPVISHLLRDADDPLYPASVEVARTFIAAVDEGRPENGWQAFIDSRNGVGTWSNLPQSRRQRFLDQSDQTKEAFISNLNNRMCLAECQRIAVPTTMVYGAETTAVDRRTTELLQDAVRGSRQVVIDRAGHMSPLTHPDAVAAVILDHLRWTESRIDRSR